MPLLNFLKENKAVILDKWVDSVLTTYSADAFPIFKGQKDRFANPVGYNVRQGLEEIFNFIIHDMEVELAGSTVEALIKVRAVQDFSPSEAVSFIFNLKPIIRKICSKEKFEGSQTEWLSFESRLDSLTLKVFDLYMACRERLHQVRIRELERGTHILTDGTKCVSAMLRQSQTKIETHRN